MKNRILLLFIVFHSLLSYSQDKAPDSIPTGMINGETCEECVVELSKNELTASIISVKHLKTPSNKKYVTKGFKMKFPNNGTIQVLGSTLNEKAKRLVQLSKVGDEIFIFGIKSIIKDDGTSLKQATPIKVKIIE